MRKISLLFAIVYSCALVNPLFAEVNIELLEQKYPKCENENFRHECFDVNLFSNAKEEGYFRNNALWDGQYFQDDILVFEFIDGERIGKSFCTDAGDGWKVCPGGNRFKPIDGGYFDINNARQGKFIFEFNNGNKFVGEFKDDLENGQGTFTWADGDKYEGEHKYGMQNGQGTYTYADGSKYVGEWKNNAKQGWATYTSSGGSKYVGEYKEGKRHGQGTHTWADGVKEVGEWAYGKLNGYAIRYDADGSILKEGIWKDDEFLYAQKNPENSLTAEIASDLPPCPSGENSSYDNCFGTWHHESGYNYTGEWKDNLQHGQGTANYASGNKYVGEYKGGKKHGQGTFTFGSGSQFSGDKYVGEFRDSEYHGQGTYTYPDGENYAGEFKDGKRHGRGTYTWADGVKEVGEYRNGKLNGYAIRYDADGKIIREGIYKDGEFLYAQKQPENSSSSGNSKLEKHKEFCEEIGFTPGSEKFAECVMVLIDTD